MNIQEFTKDMESLVAALIPEIGDEYRASGDDMEELPSMDLTIGADANGWNYQTGDNSFSGGAYSFPDWATVALYRDSIPSEVAADIVSQLADYETTIFSEEA